MHSYSALQSIESSDELVNSILILKRLQWRIHIDL
jgi:hypothetical protein